MAQDASKQTETEQPMTRQDLAVFLKSHPSYIRTLIRRGLPVAKPGKRGRLLFFASDVVAWLKGQPVKPK